LAGRIGEQALHDRGTALFAHVLHADDAQWRAEILRLSPWHNAFGETLEPASCDPERLLEQRRQELPFRTAQQEQAWQSQSQPGLPGLSGSRHGRSDVPPDDALSRSPAWIGGDETTEKPPAWPEIPGGENGCAGAPTFEI
jgi:hypothetical protein